MKKKRKLRVKRVIVLLIILVLIIGLSIFFLNKKDGNKENNNSKETKEKINNSDLKIELIGDEEITLNYKEEYQDLGAKAYYKETDISSDIKVENDLDTSKAGSYIYTYTINYKNINKSITRKITVLDNPYKVGETSKGYIIEKKDDIYYIDGIIIANKSYNLPSSYNPGDLLNIFKENFNTMKNDAKNDGINLEVISGYRSYSRQNTLYNNYVNRDGKDKADTYSARPGHSEHQTGLAADINSLSQSFENTKEGKWLNDNCYKYGFIIRYVKGKEDITGYIFEPWHIRYVGRELSEKLYNNGDWITLEEYFGIDSKY